MQEESAERVCALSFFGPVRHPATKNLRNLCCQYANENCSKVFMLFSSSGGSIDDGFSLYHFLRAMPYQIEMHNVGSIDSIALVVFAAGDIRKSCAESVFLFHDFTWTYDHAQTITRLEMVEHASLLTSARSRFKQILKSRTNLTDLDFESLQLLDQPAVKDAGFAKEKGIIQEITEAAVPQGVTTLNVDY